METTIQRALAEFDRVFHNERDFQIELALTLKEQTEATIRPEYRFPNPLKNGDKDTYVDIVCLTDDESIAIELKYPKATFTTSKTDHQKYPSRETFEFSDAGAYDMAMYPFWKDVELLEHLVESEAIDRGYVVQLTNYADCWKKDRDDLNGTAFLMHERREVTGWLAWAEETAESTKSDYPPIDLNGTYHMEWQAYEYEYPQHANGNTEFKSQIVSVPSET